MADYLKDPGSRLDYGFDWSDWLANGETITTAEMTVTTGLTIDDASHSLSGATAWLIGGTSGHTYKLSCYITTNQDRTDKRSVNIRVTNR